MSLEGNCEGCPHQEIDGKVCAELSEGGVIAERRSCPLNFVLEDALTSPETTTGALNTIATSRGYDIAAIITAPAVISPDYL